MANWQEFRSANQWYNGAIQQVITEPGETKEDVIDFMHEQLYDYKRTDLFFWPHEITNEGNTYEITLPARSIEVEGQGFLTRRSNKPEVLEHTKTYQIENVTVTDQLVGGSDLFTDPKGHLIIVTDADGQVIAEERTNQGTFTWEEMIDFANYTNTIGLRSGEVTIKNLIDWRTK